MIPTEREGTAVIRRTAAADQDRSADAAVITDEEFVASSGRNAVKLVAAFLLAVAVITATIGVFGAWRVTHAPERSDEGGVECGDDVPNRTLRQLQVCPE